MRGISPLPPPRVGEGRRALAFAFLLALASSIPLASAAEASQAPASNAPQAGGSQQQAAIGSQQQAAIGSQQQAAGGSQKQAIAIGLKQAAGILKARLYWDPLTRSGVFERSGSKASFALDSGSLLFNYSETLPVEPPRESETGPALSESFLASLERRFAEAESANKGHFSIAAILIDPGHGGKDSGAVGEHLIGGKKLKVVEKDLALDVSLRVYNALRARFPDKRILISREGDSYPTLDDRVEMANDVELAPDEAIIYVSIHANASFNKSAKGYEVWYLNPDYRRTVVDAESAKAAGKDIAPILNAMMEEEFTTESIMLAREIVGELGKSVGKESHDRGVRAEEWFVVRNVKMPSVLVEMGFVTNPEEASLLARDDYLKRLSGGIYTGIVDFVGYFETMRGPPAP